MKDSTNTVASASESAPGRWAWRLPWLLMAALVALTLLLWAYTQRVLPRTEGELALPGLRAELRIERDLHGIPTIIAASQRDAMYGLGVVHAQDRLWQLETHRRIAAGRLAEAFGEGALETDRFLRILGPRRAAGAQLAQLPQESRELLQAYADGVNAVIATLRARPPEFVILGLQPEPWTPEDSLAWAVMMAWDLSFNWQTELVRLRLALKLPKARIDELLPPYPGDPVPATADYTALYRSLGLDGRQAAASLDATVQALLAAAPPSELEGLGSNNWAVAGSRSVTGKPLLASDPHLKLSAPALWYFARLKAPGLDVAGATLPGLPGVVMGQNDKIAWGFTNTGPDVQDLYLEHVRPDDATQYRTPDGWARFITREEVIRVKGRPDVVQVVRETRHGPVLSDAALGGGPPLPGKAADRHVLALRWTGLDSDLDPLGPAMKMAAAGSVDEFIEAARGWQSPMQNMAVADAAGHIALVSPGRVPVRRADNDLSGLAPAPGWDARYDWAGSLSFDQLPRERDPERGWVASANQKIVPAGYPHYINAYWALPYRHRRIVQMIEARPRLSLDDLRDMQADQTSLAAPRLLPLLKSVRSGHPLAHDAQALLSAFEGRMAGDAGAPLIYWAWLRHLSEQVLAPKLGADLYQRTLGLRGYFDGLESVVARSDAWWCDDPGTAAVETCADQARRAFDAALDELTALQGSDVAAWRWDRAHVARSEHRPFSRVPMLARGFELRLPVGGDSHTVNVGRVNLRPDPTTGEHYLDEHGPSLRGLYDLGDRGNSRIVGSTGQSGVPWSTHYRDLAPLWQKVLGVPLFPPEGKGWQLLTVKPAG